MASGHILSQLIGSKSLVHLLSSKKLDERSGVQWLRFAPHWQHCIVSLSKAH